jgi:RNA polymerase sigma-70 factor (ECF subfamily)
MTYRADTHGRSLSAHYLRLLVFARRRMDRRLRPRLDPRDLVQESLLRAHARRDQCRAQSDAQHAAWLHSILANTLAEHRRKALGPRRDIIRECSLDAVQEDPAASRQGLLMNDAACPSHQAVTQEQVSRLIEALAQLRADQRAAVDLRHLQGYSVAEVAARMGRSTAAAAGLLRRGLQALRQLLLNLG